MAVVGTEQLALLTPERFWGEYVAKRRPCVLHGELPGCTATDWTLAFLRERAGEAQITVERRHAQTRDFGRGAKTRMPLAAFLDHVQRGDETYYMTTQEEEEEGEGEALAGGLAVALPPITALLDQFPLRPALVPTLVPAAYNLWMGNSSAGSSSGLHHDYHDNLYVLIRGCKAFHLYPPSLAHAMATHGTIAKVHPNGRICYEGAPPVLADGSDPREVELHRLRQLADDAAISDSAVDEDAVDSILDSMLDCVAGYGDDDEEEEEQEEQEGFDFSGATAADFSTGEGDGTDAAPHDNAPPPPPPAEEEAEATSPAYPNGFSRARQPISATEFPELAAAEAQEVELSPGQILYLPCGWFHEVTSRGAGGAAGTTAAEGAARGQGDGPGTAQPEPASLHMAFNYWFHPPSQTGNMAQPYESGLWERKWDLLGLARGTGAGGDGNDGSGSSSQARKRPRVS